MLGYLPGNEGILQSYRLIEPLPTSGVPSPRSAFLQKMLNLKLWHPFDSVDNGYESFFARYEELCDRIAGRSEDWTHGEVLEIIEIMKTPRLSRLTIVDIILRCCEGRERPCGLEEAQRLIDLAASTWLMTPFVHGPTSGWVSLDNPVGWNEECLFGSEFNSAFDSVVPKKGSVEFVKLPQNFTAEHLERIGGIRIRWTSNLADHLLLKNDDADLMLFHQVSILELHTRSTDPLLPSDLALETIRTIALLIPPILGEPNPWFQKHRRRHRIDASAGICDRLNSSDRQIDTFNHWRDRLVLLKRTFDDAEPRTLQQLWNDDRKKTQWFTFWVAVLVFIMTVFFGVLQTTAGIVQAWASVAALRNQG